MLTKQHIEENLSRAYIQAVASKAGINLNIPNMDYGIDGTFCTITIRGERRVQTGPVLDFQLKATTQWKNDRNNIVYDLEVKTYNDMVYFAQDNAPCILILVCLPRDESEWLEVTEEQLVLRKSGYWKHIRDKQLSNNKRTVTVRIPRHQQFTPEALSDLLDKVKTGGFWQ